jgi:hypothetical protein
LSTSTDVLNRLTTSELVGLGWTCINAINDHGTDAARVVRTSIARDEKLRDVLIELGRANPQFHSDDPEQCLIWGIACLLDGLQQA